MIDKLLGKFPYFLDKKPSSNFYKSETVFAEQFGEAYDSLFEAYLAGKVRKHVYIFKEQSEPHTYTMNFVCSLQELECVRIQKNGSDIYAKQFRTNEPDDTFHYIHEDSSENTIPNDRYRFTVKLLGGETIVREFPEVEHDRSLDEFGEFINLARRSYVQTDDYANTEIPYDDSDTECDHHYMQRLLFYIRHMQDTPLPVLEVWKQLAIPLDEIKFTNRESRICKMFSEQYHHGYWEPQRNQHKDRACRQTDLTQLLFQANADNPNPLTGDIITFTFDIMDSVGRSADSSFYIVPYRNGTIIGEPLLSRESFSYPATDGEYCFKLHYTIDEALHESDDSLKSNIIKISVKGCDEGDFYVSSDGNDNNDGSYEHPLQSIPEACRRVEGDNNLIVILQGEYDVATPITISRDTNIIACDSVLLESSDETVFSINQDTRLHIRNLNLRYLAHTTTVDDAIYVNRNLNINPLNVTVPVLEINANTTEEPALLFEDEGIDSAVNSPLTGFDFIDETADNYVDDDAEEIDTYIHDKET